MRSKLAISTLVVAALFGATAIASAQTQQPAPGASSEGKAKPDAAKLNTQPGTTTGSAMKAHTSKGVQPNPSFQDSRDAGTGRGK